MSYLTNNPQTFKGDIVVPNVCNMGESRVVKFDTNQQFKFYYNGSTVVNDYYSPSTGGIRIQSYDPTTQTLTIPNLSVGNLQTNVADLPVTYSATNPAGWKNVTVSWTTYAPSTIVVSLTTAFTVGYTGDFFSPAKVTVTTNFNTDPIEDYMYWQQSQSGADVQNQSITKRITLHRGVDYAQTSSSVTLNLGGYLPGGFLTADVSAIATGIA